jgi:hypothetical protein
MRAAQDVTLRLHDLPEGPMRDRVMSLMNAVLDFSVSCRCSDVQGDGVPCGSAFTQCSGCPKCLAILEDLETRLPR